MQLSAKLVRFAKPGGLPNMKTALTITGEILAALLIFALGFLLLAL